MAVLALRQAQGGPALKLDGQTDKRTIKIMSSTSSTYMESPWCHIFARTHFFSRNWCFQGNEVRVLTETLSKKTYERNIIIGLGSTLLPHMLFPWFLYNIHFCLLFRQSNWRGCHGSACTFSVLLLPSRPTEGPPILPSSPCLYYQTLRCHLCCHHLCLWSLSMLPSPWS